MTKKVTREMKKSSSSISERLLAADAYNKAHYERDPLHKKAADTIDELVRAGADITAIVTDENRGSPTFTITNKQMYALCAALRRATGEE